MASRQLARVPQKVTHRHRIGSHVFRRVSEIAFIGHQPKAILRWIDSAAGCESRSMSTSTPRS
jgi:hypothetical protein